MGRFDYECELCGEEGRTYCVGALRLCRKCAEQHIACHRPRSMTTPRKYRTLDDCALECGNYYNLVKLLECIGELTDTDMNDIIETLDDIFDGRG